MINLASKRSLIRWMLVLSGAGFLLAAAWLAATSLPREPSDEEIDAYRKALAAYSARMAHRPRYEAPILPPEVPGHPFDAARFVLALTSAIAGAVLLGLSRVIRKMIAR
jgi:hypothetical protein